MTTDLANIQGMFKINTDVVDKAIQDVPAERWFETPGENSNHFMWVVGHVVVHRAYVLKSFGVNLDLPWGKLFARGSEKVSDTDYPTIDEMREAWTKVSAELSAALSKAPDDVLAQPAPKGPPSFDGKVSGTCAFFAFHDTYHVGQISYLRKWLGYGQSVG